jgi:hypothetical protein
MKSFTSYTGNKNKLGYILKKADRLGFTCMDADNIAFKTLYSVKQQCFDKRVSNKFEYMSIKLDFVECMYFMNDKKKMDEWFCEHDCQITNEDFEVYYVNFVEQFEYFADNNKIIYVFIDLDGYGVDEEEEEHYSCHSCCGIFMPIGNNKYKFNYVNPHGEVMKTTDYLEHRLSSTRTKKIQFKEPVDVILMRSFIDFINDRTDDYITVHYRGNELDTYYGVNLQSGDDHGICFVVPFILFYRLGVNYYTQFDNKNDMFSSASRLLKENRIIDFVHYSFMDFNQEFKDIMINTVCGKERLGLLEQSLEKMGYRFIKDTTNTLVSFIGQSYFQKKIITDY